MLSWLYSFDYTNNFIGGALDKNINKIVNYIKDYEHLTPDKFVLHYSDIKNSIKYHRMPNYVNINCHIGQRKLLLNEIQFMTYFCKKDERELIIYIGSAPGEHLTIIKKLFPNKKYLLIDPNFQLIDDKIIYIYQNPEVVSAVALSIYNLYKKNNSPHQNRSAKNLHHVEFYDGSFHNVVNNDITHTNNMKKIMHNFESNYGDLFAHIMDSDNDIFVIQDYMGIKLANILRSALIGHVHKFNTYLISDIRTNLFDDHPSDMDIIYNEIIQIILIDAIKPRYTMLKFHPPYEDKDEYVLKFKEFLANKDKTQFKEIYSNIGPYIKEYNKITGRDIINDYLCGKFYHYKNELILLQPWAPIGSSEARLIISHSTVIDKNFCNYDNKEWEDKYAYIKLYRGYHFNDIFLRAIGNTPNYNYCGCMDCIIEQSILFCYILKYIYLSDDIEISSINDVNFYKKLISSIKKNTKIGDDLVKYYDIINKYSRYDLHQHKSAKCQIHGWNAHTKNTNYYYFIDNGKVLRIDSNLEYSYTNDLKLSDTFDPKYKNMLQQLIAKNMH